MNVASLSFEIGYINQASAPFFVEKAFKDIFSIAVSIDYKLNVDRMHEAHHSNAKTSPTLNKDSDANDEPKSQLKNELQSQQKDSEEGLLPKENQIQSWEKDFEIQKKEFEKQKKEFEIQKKEFEIRKKDFDDQMNQMKSMYEQMMKQQDEFAKQQKEIVEQMKEKDEEIKRLREELKKIQNQS
ncbi:hypothetical protein M9Y10_015439 [Tritrichomonas musculus]|uniref:Uncharacterized protein n=1 Tax=Tritrichomonas musculus TaxID=1915356 RepID=A0ABR2L2E5_9EUKA